MNQPLTATHTGGVDGATSSAVELRSDAGLRPPVARPEEDDVPLVVCGRPEPAEGQYGCSPDRADPRTDVELNDVED
jgi:hypothetical protein